MAKYYSSNRTETPPAKNSKVCPKCSGTGFYCLGVENGTPYSSTGFDCFRCSGSGWVTPKPKRVRCSRCGLLVAKDAINSHEYTLVSGGKQKSVVCE